MRTPVPVLALAVAVALLGGCTIAAESQAREVEPPAGPYSNLTEDQPDAPTQAPTDVPTEGTAAITLYLTRDGALLPVTRQAAGHPDIAGVLDALLAGPTVAEQDEGLSSALTGATVTGQVELGNGQARVDLAGPDVTGRTDAVLAFGQVVCTLTVRPEVAGVVFIFQGDPTGVPRRDGVLYDGPLTASDYDCPAKP